MVVINYVTISNIVKVNVFDLVSVKVKMLDIIMLAVTLNLQVACLTIVDRCQMTLLNILNNLINQKLNVVCFASLSQNFRV